MTTTYIYKVNDKTFTEVAPFGNALHYAIEYATEVHGIITREVINEDVDSYSLRKEYYTPGAFMPLRFMEKYPAKVF